MMSDSFLGAILAEMGSDTQAEVFNGFGRAARLTWKGEGGGISCQCYHILTGLDRDGKTIIRELAAMVGSEEEEAEKRYTENTRLVSHAEQKLEAVKRLAESWVGCEEDGFRTACGVEILAKLVELERNRSEGES